MYTKESLNRLYNDIAKCIDISDEMFDDAEREYKALGKWIDKQTPDYKICIYPQGSFGLGTIIKPINNADDYDLDLVCQFLERYGFTARELKHGVIKDLLTNFKEIKDKIESKKRCWHVEYIDLPNFHMDVIPAYKYYNHIMITDHNEETDDYEYIGSNPSGYIEWFFDKCAKQRERQYEQYKKEHKEILAQADVEDIKRKKVKTPLQRAVQLLKRHRDVMFKDKDSSIKPISIIITTIAASLYNEDENLVDTLKTILGKAAEWIEQNKKDDCYYIENPSFPDENFADKWNSHPERAIAFFEWVEKAYGDLVDEKLYSKDRISMGNHIKNIFGDETGKNVFANRANKDFEDIKSGALKVDSSTGMLSSAGTIKVMRNHHHGS